MFDMVLVTVSFKVIKQPAMEFNKNIVFRKRKLSVISKLHLIFKKQPLK